MVYHARTGLRLHIQYRDAYSYFYLSPIQLLCLVQLCDAVIRYDAAGEESPQTMYLCFTALEEAKDGFPIAGALEKMFHNSLTEYKLQVPPELEEIARRLRDYGPGDLLDACTRPTYRQPVSQIVPNIQDDAAETFISRWERLFSQRGLPEGRPRAASGGEGPKLNIGSLLNP